ncbi:MAG: hypothetical protein HND47_12925 [Chloroflexi bacterium]|nr:hypothetical protein [Chloroflexota bacterium]
MTHSISRLTEDQAVSIVRDAAQRLKQEEIGEVYVQPILQQMGVNEGVPNLVFVPNAELSKNIKRVFILEFKQTDTQTLPDIFVANANQYKRWLQEENTDHIEYGLASNGEIVTDSERESNVTPIASVKSADELVEKIHDWVRQVGLDK